MTFAVGLAASVAFPVMAATGESASVANGHRRGAERRADAAVWRRDEAARKARPVGASRPNRPSQAGSGRSESDARREVARRLAQMTPEELAAFRFYLMTPEEKQAFFRLITPTTTTTTTTTVVTTRAATAGAAGRVTVSAPRRAGSVWDRLAACESGGRWNIDSRYDGGLQFHPDTWRAYGGTAYAPYAHQATREQQIAIAERVLASQGWAAWPACSRKLGLR